MTGFVHIQAEKAASIFGNAQKNRMRPNTNRIHTVPLFRLSR